ncbi:MAG: hypothetical protein ABIJ39_06160 [Chloroflexota bacterium]
MKKANCRHVVGLIMLLLIPALAGCKLAFTGNLPNEVLQQLGDGGILSQDPCRLPCFLNLIPGESTYTDVVRALEELEIMEWCTIERDTDVYCFEYETIRHSLSFLCDQSEILRVIYFQPDSPIPVGDVISVYGTPSSLWFYSYEDLGYLGVMGRLYYDDDSTAFFLHDQSHIIYDLSPESLIEVVKIYSIDTYAEIHYMPELEVEWRGYGLYEDLR